MKQDSLVAFLKKPQSYPFETTRVEHIETHISHVFLTDDWAFKLKKPLKLDFCDFSTLEKRKLFCEREIALNKRYAAEVYEEVLALYSKDETLSFLEHGEPVEYLVKMRRFDPESVFLALQSRGELSRESVLDAVAQVSELHKKAEFKPEHFSVQALRGLFTDNFESIAQCPVDAISQPLLGEVKVETFRHLEKNRELIEARRQSHVKELHGDLHLGNICLYKGKATLFDGIEFGEHYSCCDTWADFAFLFMDLLFQGEKELAYASLNYYLALTADYEGLVLLGLYVSYRATVRAKVTGIRMRELGGEQPELAKDINDYLALSLQFLKSKSKFVVAVGGISGSGKSTLAASLAEKFEALHFKSDVIRKQLARVELQSKLAREFYSEEWGRKTYSELLRRIREALELGYSVVVDAVHLSEQAREDIERVANDMNRPFLGLWCQVSEETALDRVAKRRGDVSDADSEVVELQVKQQASVSNWQFVDAEAEPQEVCSESSKRLLDLLS